MPLPYLTYGPSDTLRYSSNLSNIADLLTRIIEARKSVAWVRKATLTTENRQAQISSTQLLVDASSENNASYKTRIIYTIVRVIA